MNYPTYPENAEPMEQARRDAELPPMMAAAESSVEAIRYATLDDLLQPAADGANTREEDYPMESGLVVRIRPLSRAEALKVNSMKGLDLAGKEQHYLARAMVAPRMTPANVQAWQERGLAGDMGDLVERVQFISGLSKKGEKAAAQEFPREGE